jgi:putative endonuclease
MKLYYVYILANNRNTVLYIGITSNIERRISEHKQGIIRGFTSKYNVDKLVYLEEHQNINEAIKREKQVKAGSRKKKEDLVNNFNPSWEDLSIQD